MLRSLVLSLRSQACQALLVAGLSIWAPAAQAAGDACTPRAAMGTDELVLIRQQDAPHPVWLQARVARDVTLDVPASRFKLANGKSQTLDHDEILREAPVGPGVLDDEQIALRADADAGMLWLQSQDGKTRYRATIDKQVLHDAKGNALQVTPNVVGLAPYRVLKGSTLRADAKGQLVIEAGALLRWEPEPAQPMLMTLKKPASLELSAPATSGAVATLETQRAPANARLRLHLSAPDLDLRAHAPTLCLSAQGRQRSLPLVLVQQEGSGGYQFETRLDAKAVKVLTEGVGWWNRVLGIPAQVRIMARVDDRPVLDQTLPLTLSSVVSSALWGLLALFVVYLVASLSWKLANPVRLVLMSIRDDSQHRSSLSNFQFLMWTLVVIFALVFNLFATDQLMALSVSVLGLLGIAGGTSVMARGIEKRETDGGSGQTLLAPATGPTAADAPATAKITPQFEPLVQKPDGQFDVLRFQMLAFTLFSLAYAAYSVLKSDGLPELPDSLYWLMGLSNLTYIGGKAAEGMGKNKDTANDAAAAGSDLSPLERGLDAARIKGVQRIVNALQTGVLDANTRRGIEGYKRLHALYPVDGRVVTQLLDHMRV